MRYAMMETIAILSVTGLFVLALAQPVKCQNATGTVLGHIQDSTGGAVHPLVQLQFSAGSP